MCYRNVNLRPPGYDVEEGAEELKLTYLDTMGRRVVVCRAENLVEQHIQDFELQYTFESVMLLQEPLLLVVAIYLFFLFVIVVVRLDFSITTVGVRTLYLGKADLLVVCVYVYRMQLYLHDNRPLCSLILFSKRISSV